MKRKVLVYIIAGAALALLVAAALKSRSVPVEVHIAQNTVATETDRLRDDFSTLVSSLESAWRDTQNPGEAAAVLRERLASSPERLRDAVSQIPGSGYETDRIQHNFERFSEAIAGADALTVGLLDEQADYAAAVTYLRDAGPQIIEKMRDIALDRIAADTFQLIVGTVDYATPGSAVQEYELRRLLVTLNRDQRIDSNMPIEMRRLLEAVTTILDTKDRIRSKLTQLASTPVIEAASNLHLAVSDIYRGAVASADSARTMLAVYAVVLLLAVGFVGFRLQASYAELNRANSELAGLNEGLEHRVQERTEELSGALAELKESQVQLVQAEKMSSLGQLVAGISHEINTPLLYLANNAAMLEERVAVMSSFVKHCSDAFSLNPDNFEDRGVYQAKFVAALRDVKQQLRDDDLEATLEDAEDLVRDSIEGLADLTDMAQSLKDFSRLDRAPTGSFDVNAGLDKTLIIARNIVKHKADVHKFYGEVPEIECSPSKINQVFLNLITNAAQAIDEHGEIVITTKLRDPEHVAVAISDTGCGIPEENLGKIRDPFFTTKEVGTGTGLGLSIVDEIIRSHGGQLLIESKVGTGSTFTVVLPLKQRQTAESSPKSSDGDSDFAGHDLGDEPAELAEAV